MSQLSRDQWCANPNLDCDSNVNSGIFRFDSDSDLSGFEIMVLDLDLRWKDSHFTGTD